MPCCARHLRMLGHFATSSSSWTTGRSDEVSPTRRATSARRACKTPRARGVRGRRELAPRSGARTIVERETRRQSLVAPRRGPVPGKLRGTHGRGSRALWCRVHALAATALGSTSLPRGTRTGRATHDEGGIYGLGAVEGVFRVSAQELSSHRTPSARAGSLLPSRGVRSCRRTSPPFECSGRNPLE